MPEKELIMKVTIACVAIVFAKLATVSAQGIFCTPSPCQNGGQCVNGATGYTCSCLAGYNGVNCENNINECDPDPCQNGGRCVDGINGYTCTCSAGYNGLNCDNNIDDCNPSPCQNGGQCTDAINGYTCTCQPGYNGINCEKNIDDCNPSPCLNGGQCVDGINGHTCTCLTGFGGVNCENNLNACNPNPCQNGGICRDGTSGYTCTCLAGYNGINCQNNINNCSPNPCLNGGVCTDGVNTYTCTCPAGFNGVNCQNNINNCNPSPCLNGGRCIDGVNTYSCVCVAGFNGVNCQNNINNCSPNPCLNGGRCTDGINTYTCTCAAGFNGANCQNYINYCAINRCSNGGRCVNGVGTFSCVCPAGFNGNICQNNINNCIPNYCLNGGRCVDGINRYHCICPVGFNGYNCQNRINYCTPNPCLNWGQCVSLATSYQCRCRTGYYGPRCQYFYNRCTPNPCRNFGQCIASLNTYRCICRPGYSGPQCQYYYNPCVPNPCLNSAYCVNRITYYTCTCRPGYYGTRCEYFRNYCSPWPCLNGGRCINGLYGYQCICPAWFWGRRCEQRVWTIRVWGEPHYTTFDNLWIPYQGRNKYIIAQPIADSGLPFFRVLTKNKLQSANSSFTVIKYVEVQLYGFIVRLGPGYQVLVNNENVIPDQTYDEFSITRNGLYNHLETDSAATNFSLIVEYDGEYGMAVALSENYKGKMEGIMGNYDGNPENDLVTRNGTDVSSDPNKFNLIGNSWEVEDSESTGEAPLVPTPSCTTENAKLVVNEEYCGLLMPDRGLFQDCIDSEDVDVNTIFKACQYDVCAYQDDLETGKELACSHLKAAAAECGSKGHPVIGWRDESSCGYTCPGDMIYKSNATACPANCENPFAEEVCRFPATESCVCPEGKTLQGGKCVEECEGAQNKKVACIAVAIDVSESIEETAVKHQEADVLGALWHQLTRSHRLDRFDIISTLFFFNDGVALDEVKVVSSFNYTTADDFIEAEEEVFETVQEDIRNRNTSGLTDMASAFIYAATGIVCNADIQAMVIISDYIVTSNVDQLDDSIQELTDAGFKVIAVGLNKERIDTTFQKVASISGLSVDLITDHLGGSALKDAVDAVFDTV